MKEPLQDMIVKPRNLLTEEITSQIEEVVLILESKKPNSVKYAIEKLKEIIK